MVEVLQHYMNPVHIYCRLRDMRIPRKSAVFLCRLYERTIFKIFSVNKPKLTGGDDERGQEINA